MAEEVKEESLQFVRDLLEIVKKNKISSLTCDFRGEKESGKVEIKLGEVEINTKLSSDSI